MHRSSTIWPLAHGVGRGSRGARRARPGRPKAKAPAPKADAAPKAAASAGKDLYPQGYYDFMLKQRIAQGQQDSPNSGPRFATNSTLASYSSGKPRNRASTRIPRSRPEIDLASQHNAMVRTYMADYLKSHPVPMTHCARNMTP